MSCFYPCWHSLSAAVECEHLSSATHPHQEASLFLLWFFLSLFWVQYQRKAFFRLRTSSSFHFLKQAFHRENPGPLIQQLSQYPFSSYPIHTGQRPEFPLLNRLYPKQKLIFSYPHSTNILNIFLSIQKELIIHRFLLIPLHKDRLLYRLWRIQNKQGILNLYPM